MGYEAEYFVSPNWTTASANDWNRELALRLGLFLERLRPQLVVFDVTWPYKGLVKACLTYGKTRTVWSYRGLHQQGRGKVPVDGAMFDLVIQPGELGVRASDGVSPFGNRQVVVPPVCLLRNDDLLDKAAARQALGLDDGRYVVFSLFLNQYDCDKAEFTIRHLADLMASATGKAVRAFRAGSFRWNADTIRALGAAGIPLSFNNSMSACQREQAIYSEATNQPFLWSNGVVEVPVTERRFSVPFGNSWWGRLQFPLNHGGRNPPWRVLSPYTWFSDSSLMVLLLHSWSLLYWDEQGLAEYRDDQRLEDYRRLVRKMSKDYDIIDTADFMALQAQGKIRPNRPVDLALAEWQASLPAKRRPVKETLKPQ